MRRFHWLLMLLLFSSGAAGFDLGSSRGYGVGGNIVLSRSNPTDLLGLATCNLASREWRIETGITRSFDLKDLDQGFIAVAGRYRSFVLVGGFSQFGHQDFYSERTGKLGVLFQRDSFAIGMSGSYFVASFGGVYSSLHARGIGAGVSYRTRWILVAIAGDNLNRPALYSSATPYQPLYSGQMELRSSVGLSTLGRVQLQKMERPRFSLGQRIGLGRTGAATWGVITAPIMLGGGLELALGHALFMYGASYHPVLGLSQTISVSLGSRGAGKDKSGDEFNR